MYQWGGTGGAMYDEAYWKEYEARQAEKRKQLREQQDAIDAEPDPEARLALRRQRYRCGERFVTLADFEPWPLHAEKLRALPDHTTVRDAGAAGGGMWMSRNDTVDITAADTQRRRPVAAELNAKVSLYQGDITALEVDAVVNAANSSLLGGGGIDGAIHGAAGPLLVEECRGLGGAETGETKITKGYALPAAHVLHTVGPIGRGDRQLRSCYRTALELVEQHRLRTVAFCCVSTGVFGFPLVRATHIALIEVRAWLERLAAAPADAPYNINSVDRVVFCTFRDVEKKTYECVTPAYFPVDGHPAEAYVPAEEDEDDFNRDDARSAMGGYGDDADGGGYGAAGAAHGGGGVRFAGGGNFVDNRGANNFRYTEE